MEIRKTMRCQEPMGENTADQLAFEVLGRVKDCSHFVAACSCTRSCSQRDPKKEEDTQTGRKPNTKMMENFKRACGWLESQTVLHSV